MVVFLGLGITTIIVLVTLAVRMRKGTSKLALTRIHEGKGRLSAGGSHMSGAWGRKKPRQAFPPANLQRGCFEPTIWGLSEIALTTASGLPFNQNS